MSVGAERLRRSSITTCRGSTGMSILGVTHVISSDGSGVCCIALTNIGGRRVSG